MKKRTLIQALLIVTFMICGLNASAQRTPSKHRWNILIKAISAVESKGDPKITNGRHAGILQISPILVDECNRIGKEKKNKKRFTYNDRFNVGKSIEMFNIIQDFYNPSHNIEKAIRIWNGGNNYSTQKTNSYFKKVRDEMRKIMNNSK